MRISLVAAGLVVALAVAVGAHASPHAPAARVVDRTMLCAASLNGGIYEVELSAQAGSGRRGSTWTKPAVTMLTTGQSNSATEALDHVLAWALAGAPAREATVIQDPFPGVTYPVRAWGTLAMAGRCRASRGRPALSRAGLGGGAIDGLGETFDCPSPRRVLVRIRAVLAQSSSLSTRRGFLGTTTTLTETRLVVATPAGKRLAYADVTATGRARLFTAPSCVRD